MLYIKMIIISFFSLILTQNIVYADVSNFLILQDIGSYKFITQTKNPLTKKIVTIPGYTMRSGAGILAGADHFDLDHIDTIYETEYESDIKDLGIEVQVTQHTGSDSDKWLLHEVERGFRRGDYEENMTPSRFRNMNGNNVFYSGLGGGTYRWKSNNIIVSIEYTDLYKQKPEPIEVVQAYLQKFPSTIPTISIDNAHNEKWIKDEMDRRLWLCDKWDAQYQLGKVQQNDLLRELVDHMNIFLDYREKYYGMKALDEKNALRGYLDAKDENSIKNKLTDYKTWWSANKNNAIILP